MNKYKTYIDEKKHLTDIYNSIKNENIINYNNNNKLNELNNIKIGDFVLFNKNGQNFNGEIIQIINDSYIVNFKNKKISVYFNQIQEHYPNNIKQKKLNEDYLNDYELQNNQKIAFFPKNTKQVEIEKFLEKNENFHFFIVEKNNELHIVKIKGNTNVNLYIKNIINLIIKRNLIKENLSKMIVKGNDKFCIIKNYSEKFMNLLKKILKESL